MPLATTGTVSLPSLDAIAHRAPRWRVLLALTKPRLATFSVLTTMVAYFAARPGANADALLLLLGTALSAAGALSLNQWRERDTDGLMSRTRHRPLPAGETPRRPRSRGAWRFLSASTGVLPLA